MLETTIKSNILDRHRKLTINLDLIEFDDSRAIRPFATQFSRGEVVALRYGVQFIKGYAFVIGRKYCIDIQGLDDRVIKIRLISLYWIKRKTLRDKFYQILKAYFQTHHKDIVNYYLELFNSQIEVNILETKFRVESIVLKGREIKWEDLGARNYATYYALFSKATPTIYQSYNYLNDWNASVIYSLSQTILSSKNLS